MRLTCLIIALSFLCTESVISQPYYFRHYQVENGLSNNTVFSITQDSSGFIWFATKDGISRFDGIHFRIFRPAPADAYSREQPNYVYSVIPDPKQGIWAGAERGLYYFDATKEKMEPFLDSLHSIHALQFDRQNRLWLIAGNTVYRYDQKNNEVKRFDPQTYFPASSLCMSNDGKMWFATVNGDLATLSADENNFRTFSLFSHSPYPGSRQIPNIRPGDGNSIFIATASQGVKRFSTDSLTYKDILSYTADRTSIFAREILKVSDEEFWFATEAGIFIYNTRCKTYTNLKKKYLDPNSLNDNAVYTLFKDKEGSVWVGTYFGGVNYYAAQNAVVQKYFPDNTENAITGNAVREICEDDFGNLWVGTEDGGLNKINKKTGEHVQFKPDGQSQSISYNNIHGLLANGKDLWIGTFEHGIDILDIPTGKVRKHYLAGPGPGQIKSNFALCFLKTSSGQIIVATSYGVYYYRPATDDFEHVPQLPYGIMVISMREAADGTIWVAGINTGLYWFNQKTGKHGSYQYSDQNPVGIPANSLNDVCVDSKGMIWVATEGAGVGRLNPATKRFEKIGTDQGLSSNFTYRILEDKSGIMWITSSKGITRYDAAAGQMQIFTQANGLLNDQFNYHSGYMDETGKLYFGSVKGMISFMPDALRKTALDAPLFITGMQIHNKDVTIGEEKSEIPKSIVFTDKVNLRYYQSSISFEFAALSYVSPEMTQYSYKLEGLDDGWTTLSNNRKIYFTNLSPGTYHLMLRAGKENSGSSPHRSLTIEITPPFWASNWAYPIYGLVAGLIIWYLFSTYHRRQQIKKEKEIYESKIEFFTNVAHELRTPLTLIKGPVENLMERKDELADSREDLDCLDRNTTRLMELVSQVLDFRQTEIRRFSLNFSRVNISEVLEEIFLSFTVLAKKKKLRYELDQPQKAIISAADAEALRKIFSNLINNAVKYAKSEVRVKLWTKDGEIKILFENDGFLIPEDAAEKIFEPFYRMKDTSHQKGTGIGLTLSRSLTTLHAGTLSMITGRSGFNSFLLTLPMRTSQQELNDPAEQQDKNPVQTV